MTLYQIIYLSITGAGFLVTLITSIIGFVKAAKARKAATTAEEKAKAEQQMLAEANKLISNAETFYKDLDTLLKNKDGSSAGVYKKENVMTKLESFAKSIGFEFDAAYWSEKIDNIVALTKQVNVKTK